MHACVYLLHLGQFSACVLVIPQVLLVPHQDDGNIGTEVLHLRCPLLGDIFCSRGGRRSEEEEEVVSWKWKWRQGGGEGLYKRTASAEWWWRTLLMMDRSADCFREKCFSCTNPVSHQGHYGICGHACTQTRIALNLQTSHSNAICLILKRSNLRT